MKKPQVRFFDRVALRVFRLSPLYAPPGWYSLADAGVSAGPYATAEHAIAKAGEIDATPVSPVVQA